MKISIIKAAVVGSAVLLAFCQSSFTQELREISFALPSKSIAASGPRFVHEMGIFAKHGIKPNFAFIDGTAGTAAGIISKSVDFGLTAPTVIVASALQNRPLIILSNLNEGLSNSLVLSKKIADKIKVTAESPVTDRLKALDGLLIATVSAVSDGTVAYKGAANAVGSNPRFTYMPVATMGAALETGAVDAMIITPPFWTFAVTKGTGVMWISAGRRELPAQFTPSSAAVAATRPDFAKENPEIVQKVVAAFAEFAAATVSRPADVKAAMGRLFPELDAATIDMVYSLESAAYNAKTLTPASITHDINLMKGSGINLEGVEKFDPSILFLTK